MDKAKPLAERMWECQRHAGIIEDQLLGVISQIIWGRPFEEPFPFTDMTTDDYDSSFELMEVVDVQPLTKEQKAALHALGFHRCWFHTKKRFEPGNKETHEYWVP